jgi:hypothetical protein
MLWGVDTNAPAPPTVRSPYNGTAGSRHSRTAEQGSRLATVATAAAQRVRESHILFFEPAACDCTCECWGYVGTPQDSRPPPNRRPYPTLSHRINGLTQMSHPYVV